MKVKSLALALGVAVSAGTMSQAAVLDFEGLGDFEEVGNFYNGGAGTNFGVEFSQGSLAIIDSDAGGGGNIGNEPSGETVLFFLDAASAIMNVAAGFTTGFSFFYSSVQFAGSVNVYDGLGATGNLLGSLNLAALGAGPGDPNGSFSNWAAVGVLFSGTAMSIDFGGVANQIAFDDVTLGSNVPGAIPVPASLPLLASALGLVGFLRRRKTM
jgi:hypothetical protein